MTSFSQTTSALSFKGQNFQMNSTKEVSLQRKKPQLTTSGSHKHITEEKATLIKKSGTPIHMENKVCVKYRMKYSNRLQKFRVGPRNLNYRFSAVQANCQQNPFPKTPSLQEAEKMTKLYPSPRFWYIPQQQ